MIKFVELTIILSILLAFSTGPPKIIDTYQVDDDDPDISIHRHRAIPRTNPRHNSQLTEINRVRQPVQASSSGSSGGSGSGSSSSSDSKSNNQIENKRYAPLPRDLFHNKHLLLNLGGFHKHEGWINVNIQPSSYGHGYVAEVLRDIGDLYGIPDNTVDALYCSHALEHMKIAQLEATLDEWSRALNPGGLLFLSVPDLKVMARYYNSNHVLYLMLCDDVFIISQMILIYL